MRPHADRPRPSLEPLEDRVVPYASLLGAEFVANTTTAGQQNDPAVAMDATGDFVVVWAANTGPGTVAQRFDAAGVAQGGEIAVQSAGSSIDPAVAMDAAGNFVVAWMRGGTERGVYARYFAADGTPAWAEVKVADEANLPFDPEPSVALTAAGFVVVWDNGDTAIHARRYDLSGTLVAEVNLAVGRTVDRPRVGADVAGNFVVAYTGGATHLGGPVYAQRFSAAGDAVGGEVVVSSDATNTTPEIAVEPDGDFVVAWATDDSNPAEMRGVFARTFAADGTARSGPVKLDSPLTGLERSPTVGVDATGNFVVAWRAIPYGQNFINVYAVRGSAAGYTYGSSFRVNETFHPDAPAVAVSPAADRFVVGWERLVVRPTTQDDDVAARLFATSPNHAPVLDAAGDPTFVFVGQDATDPHGDTVASLIGTSITDEDLGALQGIAVVGLTGTADGTWEFSIDGGATYAPFGATAETSARVLRTDDLIRFVPNAGFLGTATVTYRAWDWTMGTAGGAVDLTGTGTGGATAFSTATETATLTVTATGNHAPVLDNSGSPTLTEIGLNQVTPGNAVAEIVGSSITDRNHDALEGIAVVGLTGTANGTWEYSTDGGFSWTPVGIASPSFALLLRDTDRLRFLPNAEFEGSATVTYHAWDRTAGTPGGRGDLSVIDGVNGPFSTAQDTASVTVARFHLVGNVLNVYGTPGDDTFSYIPPGTVVLNGEVHTYPAGSVAFPGNPLTGRFTILFHGRGGTDTANVDMRQTAQIHGFNLWGTAELYEDYARIQKSPQMIGLNAAFLYDLTLSDVENVYLSAAAGDRVTFYDSAGDDTFVATPTYAYLSTPNSFFVVSGPGGVIESGSNRTPGWVAAQSLFGGNDAAWFYDSAGNDAFYANAATATAYLSGTGLYSLAYGFDTVHAVAGMGGTDTAYYYDSAGNDAFFGGPYQSYLSGFGYFYVADGFDLSLAQALYGGVDLAQILDPARNVASGFLFV